MDKKQLHKEIVYPELCYKIVGILFEVARELGPGHKEKYYENAIALAFREQEISFEQQLYTPLFFKDQAVGKYFFDFLVEKKIVLEIKRGDIYSSKKHIEQVVSYLKARDLKLGIIAQFTSNGVKYKRIVNVE